MNTGLTLERRTRNLNYGAINPRSDLILARILRATTFEEALELWRDHRYANLGATSQGIHEAVTAHMARLELERSP